MRAGLIAGSNPGDEISPQVGGPYRAKQLNLESIIIKHVTAPVWMIRDGRLEEIRFRREFRKLASMPTSILLDRQRDRLRRIVAHAAQNCPYYAEQIANAKLNPRKILVEDIHRIPILTKDIIRNQRNSLVAKNIPAKDLLEASTGGSTGLPMRFLRDRRCVALRRAQESVFDRFFGCELGDRIALFVSASHTDSFFGTWKEYIRNRTETLLLRFDPKQTRQEEMSVFYDSLMRFKPQFIKCFPNSLAVFTEFVSEFGLAVPEITAISCTGENIYSWQKSLFSEVWQAPVFERYATKECGVVSAEKGVGSGQCVFTEGVYVELLDEDDHPVAAGEPGRVVLTDLFNYGMPLLRYEIGDIAVAMPESERDSEIGFPKLKKIIGRDRDILLAADGTKRPGYLFVEEITKANLDAKFQVIQRSRGKAEVRIAGQTVEQQALDSIITGFSELLGGTDCVSVIYVEDIPRDPSGKYRYVKSELR